MAQEKSVDEVFCQSCGNIIKKKAEICPDCGVRNKHTPSQTQSRSDSSDSIDVDEAAPFIAWGGGVILALSGLGTIVDPGGHIIRAVLSGIVFIVTGLFCFPPVRNKLQNQTDTSLSRTTVVIIVFVGMVVGTMITPT